LAGFYGPDTGIHEGLSLVGLRYGKGSLGSMCLHLSRRLFDCAGHCLGLLGRLVLFGKIPLGRLMAPPAPRHKPDQTARDQPG